MKGSKTLRFVVFVYDTNGRVVVDKTGQREQSYAEFLECLPLNEVNIYSLILYLIRPDMPYSISPTPPMRYLPDITRNLYFSYGVPIPSPSRQRCCMLQERMLLKRDSLESERKSKPMDSMILMNNVS